MVEINVVLFSTKFQPEIDVEILSDNFTFFSTETRPDFDVEIRSEADFRNFKF